MRKERQGVQFIAATRTHNKYFHSSEYWLQNTEKEPDAEHKSKLLNLLFTNNHRTFPESCHKRNAKDLSVNTLN